MMAKPLSNSSRLPLYFQLKENLLRDIRAQRYPEGEAIPSEGELGASYSVSRTTVRRAIDELVTEGFLTRIQGKGTFVSRPYVDRYPIMSTPREGPDGDGLLPDHKTLSTAVVSPPQAIREDLGLGESGKCVYLRRLLLIENDAVGYAEIWIPEILVRDHLELFSADRLDPYSVYRTLEGPEVNLQLAKAVEIATAEAADEELAELLAIPMGSPVLALHHVAFSGDGQPLEALRLTFGGRRYHYRTELFRPKGTGWAGRVFVIDE